MTKPIKTSNQKISNCTPISSECVIWEGPDLQCIELCHGDTISDIQAKIATLLCDILDNKITIQREDLGCLTISGDSSTVTLVDAVKALAEEYCDLKERVDALSDTPTPDGSGSVNINYTGSVTFLKCVGDIIGADLNNTLNFNEVLALLLEALCKTYTEFDSRIDSLVLRISALEISGGGGGTGSMPSVTSSCLWDPAENPKSIVQAWSLLDADWCDYRTKLGPTAVMTDAIAAGTDCYPAINNFLFNTGDVDDLLTMGDGSGGLALSHENAWKTICALVAKVQTMETVLNSCCGFSCKKFEILVNAINFDSGTNEIDLRFTFDGSTTLNTVAYEFEDLGSKAIFTDIDGVSITHTFDITDSDTYQAIDLTGLNLTGELQIDVDVQIKVTDLNSGLVFECSKCLHTSFRTNIECSFCVLLVTVAGSDPIVEIVYTVNGNENKLTITKEGTNMEYIIPALATITSILNVNNSAVTVTSSTCPNLVIPDIDSLACYSFIIDNDYFNPVSDGYYYDIMGYMVDGVDVVTYPIPIRADLISTRSSANSLTNDVTEDCGFVESSNFGSSHAKLVDIPTNSYIFGISKLCAFYEAGSNDLFYTNIIIRAVSGKKIFLKLLAEDTNQTTAQLNQKPETYIKGVEIEPGNDCDCCYVYDGS